jgi:hypothetical protein
MYACSQKCDVVIATHWPLEDERAKSAKAEDSHLAAITHNRVTHNRERGEILLGREHSVRRYDTATTLKGESNAENRTLQPRLVTFAAGI